VGYDSRASDAGADRPQGGWQRGSAELKTSTVILNLELVSILLLLLLLLLLLHVVMLYVLLKFLYNSFLLRVKVLWLLLLSMMFGDIMLLLLLMLLLSLPAVSTIGTVDISRWTRNNGVHAVFILLS
jgi:hypothetical protein